MLVATVTLIDVLYKHMISLSSFSIRKITQLKVNKVIQLLTLSYSVVLAGWGLITPIIAVYVVENIPNAGLEAVGIGTTLYLLTRSVAQLPIAYGLDRRKGEKDDFFALFTGLVLVGTAAFAYSGIINVWQLYVIQILYGLGDALIYPSWSSLFTRHLDKDKIATETSLFQAAADLSSALSASLGALLILKFGYHPVFIIVGVATWLGAFLLIPMYRSLYIK